jgi:hypothetical protein
MSGPGPGDRDGRDALPEVSWGSSGCRFELLKKAFFLLVNMLAAVGYHISLSVDWAA